MKSPFDPPGAPPDPRAVFDRVAEERLTGVLTTGESVPWTDAKAYLEAKARGERPPRPTPRKLALLKPGRR